MKTRTGKIAQLPKPIRDDLNQRLQNGNQGPELLKWLNGLPETKELLIAKFDNKPITTSNLSDWRQGGFQEWLRDQAREQRIQRISESGDSLEQAESGDLFENFSRMAVAELAADLDSLHDMKDRDARWQRLRELCRELARLQHGYNHSRRTELAWTKYNGPSDDPPVPPKAELETRNPKLETPSPTAKFVPNRAQSFPPPTRYVHHAPCGCVCRKCHPADGPYPYWDAERDAAAWNGSGMVHRENGETFYFILWKCDCTCQRCDFKNLPEPADKARRSVFRIIHNTKCTCNGNCQKCHAPDSEYPMANVLRDEALIEERHSSILRSPEGISTCVRVSYCDCPCEQCKRTEIQEFQNTLASHEPPHDKNPASVAQAFQSANSGDCPVASAPDISPIRPISPIPQPKIPTYDPIADFRRQTALLKTLYRK